MQHVWLELGEKRDTGVVSITEAHVTHARDGVRTYRADIRGGGLGRSKDIF